MGGWKVACIVVVLLYATVGTAWVVGNRLPMEHVAVATGVVQAAPGAVWRLMTNTVPQQNWRTGVRRVQNASASTSAGLTCWSEELVLRVVPFCVVEEEAGVRRVVKVHTDRLSFSGTTTYELAPAGGGTQVTITQRTQVKRPIWRFWGEYVLRDRTQARQYLRDLQAEAIRRR